MARGVCESIKFESALPPKGAAIREIIFSWLECPFVFIAARIGRFKMFELSNE
jgi:hypothetical protein